MHAFLIVCLMFADSAKRAVEPIETSVVLDGTRQDTTARADGSIFVKNSGTDSARVRLALVARDAEGHALGNAKVTLDGDSVLPGGTARTVPFHLTWSPAPWPVSGALVMDDGRKSISVTVNLQPEHWSGRITIAAVILAALLTIICAIAIGTWKLTTAIGIGTATWDYKNSWASNINAAGALLTTFLAVVTSLTQPVFLSKTEYGLTSLLFGAFVVLAPTAYNLLQVSGEKAEDPPHGTVLTFLICAFLTLAGVCGQLLTLGVLLVDFTTNDLLSWGASWVFLGTLAGAGIAVIIYSIVTARRLVQRQPQIHEDHWTDSAYAARSPAPAAGGGSAPARWAVL